jgi:hypothetical protein
MSRFEATCRAMRQARAAFVPTPKRVFKQYAPIEPFELGTAPKVKEIARERERLYCSDMFPSDGPGHRYCQPCKTLLGHQDDPGHAAHA